MPPATRAKMREPDMKEDFAGWNRYQETILSQLFKGRGSDARACKAVRDMVDLPESYYDLLASSQDTAESIRSMKRDMCILQRDLSSRVAQISAADKNFEARWLTTSAQEQEKYIVEGLRRTCMMASEFADRRLFVPEVVSTKLLQDKGRGFLALLQRSLLSDPQTVPKEPTIIRHAAFEEVVKADAPKVSRGKKVLLEQVILGRSYFISFFLWNTLLSFYGLEEKAIPIKTKGGTKVQAVLDALPDRKEQTYARDVQKMMKEEHKGAEYMCSGCRQPASRLPSGVVLQVCGGCKSVGRDNRYCSRDCQVHDWRKGGHKGICGKRINDAGYQEAAPRPHSGDSEESSIPHPDEGYKRSPALLHQISLLKDSPHCDYVLDLPTGNRDVGITLSHPIGRMAFLFNRDRAMGTGDEQSVFVMFRLLQDMATQSGLGRAGLIKQLSLWTCRPWLRGEKQKVLRKILLM